MKPIICTFSGAGLSRESGIPTFRDSDGLWHGHKVEDVASPQGWLKDKQKVLRFYEERSKNISDAEPNDAHKALAALESRYRVLNFTQNIDDLLERAGCSEVYHLHGSIRRKKCEFHSNIPGRFDENFHCYYEDIEEKWVTINDICPVCSGNLRPDVVWFGESVDIKMFEMLELAAKTDIFIGIGTSANVQPAASILSIFKNCKERYFIDPNPPGRLVTWKLLEGPATREMSKLSKQLMERK